MVTIRLHNTLTRRKEVFEPLDPQNVRMYVCGPTVYDRAHIGNARPVVVFDTLFRLLRHVYGAEHVTYARNFTDVDDKINAEAQRRKAAGAPGTLEELIRQRTEETIAWYHADMDALGALRPTFEPRATDYIGAMQAMIADLIASGHAYAAEGHVLFRVRSYAEYGRLSGRSVDDMIAGARVEVAPFKEDPMDFVLWKPSDEGLPGWDSPWGRGRPGWHIECSAMSYELFGPAFDIHGGGIDLQFPHHENEIAQSCCAHPSAGFAKVWMHNEMLQVEGEKMSKSLGNFFTVREILEGKGPTELGKLSGLQIRLAFLLSHYRETIDFSTDRMAQVNAIALDCMSALAAYGLDELAWIKYSARLVPDEVVDALCDDLNTPRALVWLHGLAKEMRRASSFSLRDLQRLYSGLRILGLDLKKSRSIFDHAKRPPGGETQAAQSVEAVNSFKGYGSKKLELYRSFILELRREAAVTRDFSRVDAARNKLAKYGVEVRFEKSDVRLLRGFASNLRILPRPENLFSES